MRPDTVSSKECELLNFKYEQNIIEKGELLCKQLLVTN